MSFRRILILLTLSVGLAERMFAAFDPASEKLNLYWKMDEHGRNPIAFDISGHGRHGLSINNVTGSPVDTREKRYAGFTTTKSTVYCTNAVTGSYQRNWTAVAWIRNVDYASDGVRFIACGASTNTFLGENKDRSWQVWITNNTVAIGLQDWGGFSTNNLHETDHRTVVNWKPDVWYQIAMIYENTADNSTPKKLSVRVTEAGAKQLGPVVSSLEILRHINGHPAFIVGAAPRGYYSGTSAPPGFLGGEMREVSFWDKCLTEEELMADVATFTPCEKHPADRYELLHWNLNETGTTPTALDASTNGHHGTSFGNVIGATIGGTNAYRGFTTQNSFIAAPAFGETNDFFRVNRTFDILMWVRNPQQEEDVPAILARGALLNYGRGSDVPFQAWVNANGSVSVSMRDFGGRNTNETSQAISWQRGRWHQVLIRRDYLTHTTERIRVWVTPAGKDTVIGDPVVEAISERAMVAGSTFCVGGGYPGWNSTAVGGYWGGEIGAVSFLNGQQYGFADLEAQLPLWDLNTGLMIFVK